MRERLLALLSSRSADTAELDEAVTIMREAGSVEFARTFANRLVVDAKAALERELPKSKARNMLAAMSDFFVKRNT
jgi:geranylgeranyl diphosphate synthase type I